MRYDPFRRTGELHADKPTQRRTIVKTKNRLVSLAIFTLHPLLFPLRRTSQATDYAGTAASFPK